MRLSIGKYTVEYDENYGIDKRSGWTLTIDGIVICQLTSFCNVISAILLKQKSH